MKKLILSFLAIFATISVFAQKTVDIPMKNFTIIEATNAFNVVLTKSEECRVKVECPDHIVENLNVIIDNNNKLTLDLKWNTKLKKGEKIIAYVGIPYLESLKLSGAATLKSKERFTVYNEFNCDISGAAKVQSLDIKCDVVNLACSGAADVNMDIYSDLFKTNISGAAEADLNINTYDSNITVSGAADVDFNLRVRSKTDIDISGSANLNIYGYSDNLNLKASGSSRFYGKDFEVQKGFIDSSGTARYETNIKSMW